jgi:hypothetical protein
MLKAVLGFCSCHVSESCSDFFLVFLAFPPDGLSK